ncbi:spore protease YyaC [Falsibacillus pallidus]|uniref:Putative sporulation protein YyaC n=1 Tax=Falsibacillus pallidus TaxID=493781 RepID=A0A370GAM0_9BACI|nr:spore protease YyaC [Falsibacillus pallidus]RDI40882.1 putative sporulation protein YyaC [Falsibacillus pallidus]
MNLKKGLFDRKGDPARIAHDAEHASGLMAEEIVSLLPSVGTQPIVVACIGTDRSTGDSLGPLIGTLLEEKNPANFFVYGTLEDPIHAVNLAEKLAMIEEKHPNPFVIGIDACLGRMKSVGVIQVGNGPVKPGAGVNKELQAVGNMHITGIVNVSGFMEFFVLQNTRLNLVLKMARTMSEGLYEASLHYQRKQSWFQMKLTQDAELKRTPFQ